MKSFGIKRLVGFALAAMIVGAPLAAAVPALAQEAAPAAAPAADPAAPAAEAAAPADTAAPAAAPADAAPAEVAAPEKTVDKGDVAWMLASTALVLVMTIPGLALFYGGLVRQKNMASVLMQVSTIAVIGMIAWTLWGYSLAFTDGGGMDSFIGGTARMFGAGLSDGTSLVATFSTGIYLPEIIFFAFQMTFAAITPGLVVGAIAERMKFSAIIAFAILWPLICYYPIAHMVWWWAGPDTVAMAPGDPIQAGFIWGKGALDFAGGTVVHINAGFAGLVACLLLGKRKGYPAEPMPPHSLTMTLIGTGLLWFGWFGFNAGSNLEANFYAALALTNTLLATAAAGLSWIVVEWITRGKPSLLGLCSGIVAGLVAVTPAAGFAGPVGAIVLGLVVSPICLVFVSLVKKALKYDDSLDVFGIHGIGGVIGAIGTGILVNPALGGAGVVDYTSCAKDGDISTCDTAAYDLVTQVTAQLWGVGTTILWTVIGSLIVFGLIKYTIGLRASPEVEEEGLDITEHGERAYHA